MRKLSFKTTMALLLLISSMFILITNLSVSNAQDSGTVAFSIGQAYPIYDDCNKLVASKLPSANITSAYFVFGSDNVRVDAKVETYENTGPGIVDGYTDTAVFYFPPNNYNNINYASIGWGGSIEDRSALVYISDGVEYRYDGIAFEYPGYGSPQCDVAFYNNETGAPVEFPREEYDSWFNNEDPLPPSLYNFSDVVGTTFETYISNLATDQIVKGYPDGLYHPEREVTRGQLAKFVKLAFNIETDTSCGAFTDVQPGHTFYEHVTTLKCTGIVAGFPDGTYGETDGVTRGQVSKFVTNAMKVKGVEVDLTKTSSFVDVQSTNSFYQFVSFLTNVEANGEKVIKGYPTGLYEPNRVLNRGEMAKIVDIARMVD